MGNSTVDDDVIDSGVMGYRLLFVFFFQAEDGIRDFCLSRGLGMCIRDSQEAKDYLDKEGIEYVERTGTTTDEVQLAADALVADGVDAVFTPTDNTIMTAELSIYEKFIDAGIPQYTGADSFALNGAFVGYGVDYANLGQKTADMIADILMNDADPATTSVETFDNGTATVNTETCEGLGLDLETVKKDFEPLCTQVNEIVTAESFDDVEK